MKNKLPQLITAEALREFSSEIHREHLEEASSLYEQRLSLFDDPEITWLDIEDFEDRFEPHIDGLVVGENLALEVCKQQARAEDFGELHAAVRVFCREGRKDLLLEVLDDLDPEDDERVLAVGDALKYELPKEWEADFIHLLRDGDKKLVPLLAGVAGYRRMDAGRELVDALQQARPSAVLSIVRALGRVREPSARPLLFELLKSDDGAVCSAAASALLKMGEGGIIDHCLAFAESQTWTHIPIGLAGSRSALPILGKIASGEDASPDCLMALGLLGDVATVDLLLARLGAAEFAESAALALNLVTGAELYEEAFFPEEIEEDELFEEELEDFRQGKVPTRPDGEPFGITIERISQKQEEWQAWWKENRPRFKPGIGYRNGKPHSPACLLENLESEKSPNQVRKLAYEELVIRYGVDIPFETDMPVSEQKYILRKYADWIKLNGNRFRGGKWYSAGQLMPEQRGRSVLNPRY